MIEHAVGGSGSRLGSHSRLQRVNADDRTRNGAGTGQPNPPNKMRQSARSPRLARNVLSRQPKSAGGGQFPEVGRTISANCTNETATSKNPAECDKHFHECLACSSLTFSASRHKWIANVRAGAEARVAFAG